MGVYTYAPKYPQVYPQVYPQLYLQPIFENETNTIFAPYPTPVLPLQSGRPAHPFNTWLNILKQGAK